jgi:hypothetical protein
MESADMTTQQLMFSLIEIWKTSGKTQMAFCQEKDLAYHKFHYWFRKYNQEHGQTSNEPPFVSVSLPRPASSPSKLELVYPDGRRLIFHQQVDAGFLRALLG